MKVTWRLMDIHWIKCAACGLNSWIFALKKNRRKCKSAPAPPLSAIYHHKFFGVMMWRQHIFSPHRVKQKFDSMRFFFVEREKKNPQQNSRSGEVRLRAIHSIQHTKSCVPCAEIGDTFSPAPRFPISDNNNAEGRDAHTRTQKKNYFQEKKKWPMDWGEQTIHCFPPLFLFLTKIYAIVNGCKVVGCTCSIGSSLPSDFHPPSLATPVVFKEINFSTFWS